MSREIAEELADRLVTIRKASHQWYETMSRSYRMNPAGSAAPEKVIAGGVVRSYKFNYEEGKEIAQGSMRIMFSKDSYYDFDITVVILNDSEANGGVTGERIVHNTRKLSDFNESVLEAYFSAYCSDICKWIVVYEKFESYFDTENQNVVPRLCNATDLSCLNDFWKEKLRSLVMVLAASKNKQVIHGGLSLVTGYAISGGTIKLINIARLVLKRGGSDLADLMKFLGSNRYLEASSCADWQGFDFLLRSKRMNQSDWDRIVLGHPILLDASESGKLNAYEGVEINMWRLTERIRKKFASALRIAMPEHHDKDIKMFFPQHDPLLQELQNRSNLLPDIYLAIIQTIRNLSRHAELLDGIQKCQLIHKRFGGYMSMAYSVSKLSRSEWDEMESKAFLKKMESRA